MGLFPVGRWLAVAAAAALCGCERAEPPRTAAAAPEAQVATPEPQTGAGASEPVVIPPFDPSLPPLKLEMPQVAVQPSTTRAAKRPTRDPAALTAPASPEYPPLDVLLRAPRSAGPSAPEGIDLAAPASDAQIEPKPPGALDKLGQSIRLESRNEAIGPSGPRQGTYYETDAGVRIPVDKDVSLEGGVRVDSREEPGAKEPERRSTPRVGVEVRF
jgi:hypothetical protein